MTLWLVGKVLNRDDPSRWEFGGIYDDQQKAEDTCTSELMCVARIELNHTYPDESVDFEYCYYPNLEDRPA